jgi:hypothetical protein
MLEQLLRRPVSETLQMQSPHHLLLQLLRHCCHHYLLLLVLAHQK